MEYQFRCNLKPVDLWKMTMSRTYRSLAGAVNFIFSVAILFVTVRIWPETDDFCRGLLLLGCLLFPVIQPLAIYGRSVKLLEDLPGTTELTINDAGVFVTCGGQKEFLGWNRIQNAVKRRDSILLLSDASHGYVLVNKTLGDQKEELFKFLCSKIQKQKEV